MIKENIIELIHLLTDIDSEAPCSFNESKNFDKKINDLIRYIKNIKERSN